MGFQFRAIQASRGSKVRFTLSLSPHLRSIPNNNCRFLGMLQDSRESQELQVYQVLVSKDGQDHRVLRGCQEPR